MTSIVPAREDHLDGWAALRHALCHGNHESHAFHLAAGFAQTECVVYFRQEL